jgi:cellobiose phosphorylase
VTDSPATAAPLADSETRPAEVFSHSRLEGHAAQIAASHRLAANPRRGRPLLPRLDESAVRLEETYRILSAAYQSDRQPIGSEDWLRDNHHVVLDQIREIRQDLPRKYYLELAKLADGPFQGYPRVYLMARELITHTAARVDLDTLIDFTSAYQRTSELSIGEIWAIPIMLRLALVEDLARLADGVVAVRRGRERARRWHVELTDRPDWAARSVRRLLEDGRQDDGRLSPAFVVELLQWLRDQPATAAPAWHALQRALQDQGDSADEMLRIEHKREAADQLEISNIITTMRLLSSIEWTLFFERVSLVEQRLREDPAGAYALMDFATRDRYRHSIEELAKGSGSAETTVADQALQLARAAQRDEPHQDRRHHVGYYLISRGRFQLERHIGYSPTLAERHARFAFRHPAVGYLGSIAAITALGVASMVAHAARAGATPAELWLVAALVLLPVSELGIGVLNLILTGRIPPRPLPKLALDDGIPVGARTMVVVPTIVGSAERLDALIDDLEVRFFGNRDPHLHFALLSDFPDADRSTLSGEAEILSHGRQRIDELNARHGADRFFFFHRERRWNGGERRWMAWERKRGKLAEFNRLLRGATDTSFIVRHGDLSVLPTVRYVITLDSDTQLPINTARRLVGTLAHPLNRARFDPTLRRVTEGYGVLQPRVSVDVVSANRSAFAKVYSGHVGVDPYTTAVSDIYQDLFHEGSYVGKGIYEVDAFEAALRERVPENALLSHDLFEGLYARAGLCTDINVVDDYPTHYLAFAARQHRWVRGDWQIVRWLWRTVPDAARRVVPNTLPVIARWKLLDNLRRSVLMPALLLLLAAGWTILPGSALLWTVLALLVFAFPAYVQVARSLSSRVRGVPIRQHIAAETAAVVTSARQSLLSAAFLAHQSWLMADAVARTLWRLMSRRHLLEWAPAEEIARLDRTLGGVTRQMWAAPVLAGGIALAVAVLAPERLALALPLIGLWLLSPALAHATGRPMARHRQPLAEADRAALRKVARRTWRFFEDLVGPTDNWLVPDNYQENRGERVAHRTSPTNIGLQVLSTLAAYDLGYLSCACVVDRLERTFATLQKLPRYRGHFYNWYDTRTLTPLAPSYISTVDSGNLAGYLLTLKNGLIGMIADSPILDGRALQGIGDAIALAEAALANAAEAGTTGAARGLRKEISSLHAQLAERPSTLRAWRTLLSALADRVSAAAVLLHEIDEAIGDPRESACVAEALFWLDRAAAAVGDRLTDLERLAPWTLANEAASGLMAEPEPALTLAALLQWCGPAAAAFEGRADADVLRGTIERTRTFVEDLIDRTLYLSEAADDFVQEMEAGFLFDRQRRLFSIGFSVTDGRLDNSYYDTLASEARLGSFVAIATGQISHDHWFKLGRSLTTAGRARALLSWSASMFEYFMPLLVMRSYPDTLLDETYRAVVQRQIQYAVRRGVPWGISESAYNAQDLERNYQYRAFGVPGLGLKRGLAEDLVIAPYACILAAPLVPAEVRRNLDWLAREGVAGTYGFYEAIDYTPERTPEGQQPGVVLRTYMAHHQGMCLVALDNALHDAPMQQRFHADPRVQAADLLLQEQIPHLVPLTNPPIDMAEHVPSARRVVAPQVLRYTTPHTLSPRIQLLSNGSYHLMLTNAGGGYSRRQGLALTRWRDDVTTDAWGSFCYVRDLASGSVWSTAHQPTGREADEYEVTFAPDRAVFRRLDGGIETRTEVIVSPEDDAELRRVSVTNHTSVTRSLDLTSYAEVVLAPHDADLAHPAFSNLFIETRSVPERDALICMRRPRDGSDPLFMIHVLSGRGRVGVAPQYETDRARFLGRGGTRARPAALDPGAALSDTTGPVLDPIVSLRQTILLPPGATARLTFTTAYAVSEAAARQLIDKYRDRRVVTRAVGLASTHSQIELRHMGLAVEDVLLFQRLAGRLVSKDRRLRALDAVEENSRGPRELWKHGISGDLPLLLVRLGDASGLPLVSELLKAHEYLRIKGLQFDLVVLNEHPASYLQNLQEELVRLVESGPEHPWVDRPGGVFLRRADLVTAEDQLLLKAAARAVMDAADGGLRRQLAKLLVPVPAGPPLLSDGQRGVLARASPARVHQREALELFNGFGGFADDGREYVVRVNHGGAAALPPVPWSNVVAHAGFGFACTESGTGYTWSQNSYANRLTPWYNDPVSDSSGESLFIRDEETGAFWSATPLPAGGDEPYVTRHGHGYSGYRHERADLASDLVVFVPQNEPVKVFRLALRNTSSRWRRCAVTLYAEWVLGDHRSRTAPHVVSSIEPATGAILARNAFREEFAERVAFLDLSPGTSRSVTGHRGEFIGRNGTLERPAALGREALSNRTGAGLDPCGAVQVSIELGPSEEKVLIGLLGEGTDTAAARGLIERFRDPRTVDAAAADVRRFWDNLLGTVTVRTPDRSMNLMLNRWLLYQTLACRFWGRSAFYQSSGAFGFRDQLQDALALLHSAPALARAHLLRAASRQFVEGDVQHWWHEPGGQGVRTRFSDDRLWLVFAALEYVNATGDESVLAEQVGFVTGRRLEPGEHEAYERPGMAAETASVYEHCVRAIDISLGTGPHGLPLMGTGDWNDGMNLVGAGGTGESVWLAWFLVSILRPFAAVAEARGDVARAEAYRATASSLVVAIEQAWDGDWYRRAYFDDGTPLGSRENSECQIDAIAQSWAVISGAGDAQRARQAMAAVYQHLVRRDDGLVLLLTPPFDQSRPSPGYIRGYLPGVRENGGQYTHAALWNILAFARLGDGDRAWELFSLLNPITHSLTPEEAARYHSEPYVIAADVYSMPPHTSRGGWTWYTGSAGWMYRVGLEAILGITLKHGALQVDPCIASTWSGYEATVRRGRTTYRIVVENPSGVNRGVRRLELDGVDRTGHDIPIVEDEAEHAVRVVLG